MNGTRFLIGLMLGVVGLFVLACVSGCTAPARGSHGFRTIRGPAALLEGAPGGITSGHVNEGLDHDFFVWTVARDKGTDADCLPMTPTIWPYNQVFEVKNGSARFWVREGEVLCAAPAGKQADLSLHFQTEPFQETR
jgi:hypothetical protein